jgi:ABC-type glycerol-3-phosphate transport system permease component
MVLALTTGVAIAYPVYWMLIASMQPEGTSLAQVTILIPETLRLDAYRNIFLQRPIPTWLWNTFRVSAASSLAALTVSILAAYSLTRFHFSGKGTLGFGILLAQLLPASALIVPLFLIFRTYRLLDTLAAVGISYTSFTVPLAVWVLWGYLQAVPKDFEEAAMVDGCTQIGAFLRTTLPLSLPGVAATALYAFLEAWNEYLLAFVLTSSPERWTVSVGLFGFINQYVVLPEQMMAASLVATMPAVAVFLLLQQFLREGLTLGGVTG